MGASTLEKPILDTKPDFGGWATKADLECTDGLTIGQGAFAHQDGKKVPIVWSHKHDDPELVLGHAILKNREGHTYSDLYFNPKQPKAVATKFLIEHGDLDSLSIWANKLKKVGSRVIHGMIREVSVVLAGANPGAKIDFVNLSHDDWDEDFDNEAATITMGFYLEHDGVPIKDDETAATEEENVEHAEGVRSAQDVFDSMNEEQQAFLMQSINLVLAGKPMEHSTGKDDPTEEVQTGSEDDTIEHTEGTEKVSGTRRIFENNDGSSGGGNGTLQHDAVLAHSDILEHGDSTMFHAQDKNTPVVHIAGAKLNELFHIAKEERKSFRSVVKEYARTQESLSHAVGNLDLMFPDAVSIDDMPQLKKRRTEWVDGVLSNVSRRPFSRIKTLHADITGEEARARGHIKGELKVDEFFEFAKRSTSPTMVYKRQTLDREDILEITEYNLLAFVKGEMRLMLDEELARAILIGDGRENGDPGKIRDPGGAAVDGRGVRSILNDHELYAPKVYVNLQDAVARGEGADKIQEAIDDEYKGSGSPTFYSTLKVIGKMVRERDADGKRLYRNRAELAEEMGVDAIVPVEVLETVPNLVGIAVNLRDYVVGTNQGGEITMFEDFDLDYNQEKRLLETYLSGALNVLASAIVVMDAGVANAAAALVTPTEPTFDEESGELTIVNTTGVVYKHGADTVNAAGSPYALDPGEEWVINAIPSSNAYYFKNNVDDEWTFTADEA